jgi:hypothetical protein
MNLPKPEPELVTTGLLIGWRYPTPEQKAELLRVDGASYWSDTDCVMVPKESGRGAVLCDVACLTGGAALA